MTPTLALEFVEVEVAPALAVQMSGQCAADPASISEAMRQKFQALFAFIARHHLVPNGPPRAIYTAYDPAGLSFLVAVPVTAGPAAAVEDPLVLVDTLPETKAYRFTHHGPYANLPRTYNQITAFLKEKGWLRTDADWARYMPMWEEYLTDPE
jgi:effector-binding domain-containing protein